MFSLDHHRYFPPSSTESSGVDGTLALATPVPDFYIPENLYLWQDVDGIYHWADGSPRVVPEETAPPTDHCEYRHGDLEDTSQPAVIQDNSYIFHMAQQFRDGSGRSRALNHGSSIASDNSIARGPSISGGEHSSRRGNTLNYELSIQHPSDSHSDPRPPSRKRSRKALDELALPPSLGGPFRPLENLSNAGLGIDRSGGRSLTGSKVNQNKLESAYRNTLDYESSILHLSNSHRDPLQTSRKRSGKAVDKPEPPLNPRGSSRAQGKILPTKLSISRSSGRSPTGSKVNQNKRKSAYHFRSQGLAMQSSSTSPSMSLALPTSLRCSDLPSKPHEEAMVMHEAVWPSTKEKRGEEEEYVATTFPGDLSICLIRDGKFPVAAGGCADIYKGTLKTGQTEAKVAIKAIKVYSSENDHSKKTKQLRREIKVWMMLNHPNVLPLYGTTSGFGPFPAMVCPWLDNGTLTSYLEHRGADLEMLRVLALICDVASGLQYLHSQLIVHGDLSGSNVLIDANCGACIADFGLSTMLDEIGGSIFATSGKPRGTLRWAAPELLDLVEHGDVKALHSGPTIQSDIYSFGGIMLQVLSGKVPYHYYHRDMQVVAAIYRGETPMRPDNARVTDYRWGFIQRCWSPMKIIVQRPSSEEIVAFSNDDLLLNMKGNV